MTICLFLQNKMKNKAGGIKIPIISFQNLVQRIFATKMDMA